jgi:hypothetical protein
VYAQKPNSHIFLREGLYNNNHDDTSSLALLKEGSGLENFDKVSKMLEPWEILLELGHF